jgi:hypothetical protein
MSLSFNEMLLDVFAEASNTTLKFVEVLSVPVISVWS